MIDETKVIEREDLKKEKDHTLWKFDCVKRRQAVKDNVTSLSCVSTYPNREREREHKTTIFTMNKVQNISEELDDCTHICSMFRTITTSL